jgi:hypothetical protein
MLAQCLILHNTSVCWQGVVALLINMWRALSPADRETFEAQALEAKALEAEALQAEAEAPLSAVDSTPASPQRPPAESPASLQPPPPTVAPPPLPLGPFPRPLRAPVPPSPVRPPQPEAAAPAAAAAADAGGKVSHEMGGSQNLDTRTMPRSAAAGTRPRDESRREEEGQGAAKRRCIPS